MRRKNELFPAWQDKKKSLFFSYALDSRHKSNRKAEAERDFCKSSSPTFYSKQNKGQVRLLRILSYEVLSISTGGEEDEEFLFLFNKIVLLMVSHKCPN